MAEVSRCSNHFSTIGDDNVEPVPHWKPYTDDGEMDLSDGSWTKDLHEWNLGARRNYRNVNPH